MSAQPPVPALRHVWRASRLASPVVTAMDSGFARLNAELPGGGWPASVLTELITRESGIGELRLLVPLLRRLTRERKVVVLLAPPLLPYAPALASFGIDLDYLLMIEANNPADRLWAVEQTLASASFGALLAWLPERRTRPEHLRCMQLAAQGASGPVFLFRELAAQFDVSPAPLRLLLLPRPAEQLSVQILKRRGPVMAMPMMLDLPRPLAAIHLRAPATETAAVRVLGTAHALQPAAPVLPPETAFDLPAGMPRPGASAVGSRASAAIGSVAASRLSTPPDSPAGPRPLPLRS
ncbi:MAG: translesion DNA synthesis-associated protein ImuA [Burkholderiaceae bacterium]